MEARINGVRDLPQMINGSDVRYAQPPGYLGVIKKEKDKTIVFWYHCREQFQTWADVILPRGYFVSCGDKKDAPLRAAQLINQLEKHVDADFSSFSYVRPGGSHNYLWVEPSLWWLHCPMRHSFFTIALRAGIIHWDGKPETWKTAIHEHPYSGRSKDAVNKFLEGRTRYTGKDRWWVRQFSTDSIHFLEKPESKTERQKKLQEMAYFYWLQDGQQPNRELEYWNQAEEKYYKLYE